MSAAKGQAVKVEFHAGAADPMAHACRLLRKAWRQGARVVVTAREDTLATLDRQLWVFDPQEFLPHVRWRAALPAGTQARTPVWLATQLPAVPGCPGILVNLDAEPPAAGAPLSRVIELVGRHDDAVQAARQRWRHYQALGLEPQRVQLAA